jgi:hypothetical protein
MNFHINSIESFSAHPDGHSCLVMKFTRKRKLAEGPRRHARWRRHDGRTRGEKREKAALPRLSCAALRLPSNLHI